MLSAAFSRRHVSPGQIAVGNPEIP